MTNNQRIADSVGIGIATGTSQNICPEIDGRGAALVLSGAYKAFTANVIALRRSVLRMLADMGVRVREGLTAPDATDFWLIAGDPYQSPLPSPPRLQQTP
jgi:hypothetical protein